MITAALAWYDEPTENLTKLVLSLDGIASNLVALDGRWDLMPGDTTNSPDEQAAEIDARCREIGLPLALYRVEQPWDSQVAKRSALMHLARTLGRQPWAMIIDGDEYISQANPPELHRALAHTEADVCQVLGQRHGNGMRPSSRPIRRLYRSSTGVTIRYAHNGYVTADGRWLHGDPAYVRLEKPADLSDHLAITNHVRSRSPRRNEHAQTYHHARARTKTEQWPRGLKP